MSRYANDYLLAPARPSGWRRVFASVVAVTAIAAVSAISGGVVALELLAPDARDSAAPVLAAAAPASVMAQASARASGVRRVDAPTLHATPVARASDNPSTVTALADVTPVTPAPADAAPVAAAQPAPPATVTAAAPSAAALPSDDVAATASASELTFAKGYALRRAAHEAAARQGAKQNDKVAGLDDTAGRKAQAGRPALKRVARPSVAVAQNSGTPEERRYPAFERFQGPAHHEALAFGDTSAPRPVKRGNPAPGNSGPLGGLFEGLF
jgi:hypothetical protein